MTREIIATIVEAEGGKSSNKGHSFAEATDLTFFISTAGDVLQIPRVSRIDLRDKYICLETAKQERFFFAYEDILGCKTMTSVQAKDRAAGFAK